MALSWNAPQGPTLIADRDLYLDKSRDVLVEERDAASLLCGHGREIYADEVARLGLVMVDGRVVQVKVTRLDGKPLERGEDGLIHGEPLNLTDEERANLPPLGEADPNAENVFAEGKQESHGESEG